MAKNSVLFNIAGWLIVALLSVLSWFTVEGINNNKHEHQQILDELQYIKIDVMNIKYIIIEYHPKSVDRFYRTRGANSFIPKPYEQFNCIVN